MLRIYTTSDNEMGSEPSFVLSNNNVSFCVIFYFYLDLLQVFYINTSITNCTSFSIFYSICLNRLLTFHTFSYFIYTNCFLMGFDFSLITRPSIRTSFIGLTYILHFWLIVDSLSPIMNQCQCTRLDPLTSDFLSSLFYSDLATSLLRTPNSFVYFLSVDFGILGLFLLPFCLITSK